MGLRFGFGFGFGFGFCYLIMPNDLRPPPLLRVLPMAGSAWLGLGLGLGLGIANPNPIPNHGQRVLPMARSSTGSQ